MSTRKRLTEELMGNLYAIKQRMHAQMVAGKKWNITYAQQLVLFLVSQSPTIGIKGIANMLCISSSAATQLVNELVREGYVVRKTNPKDRRELDLFASAGGTKIIKELKRHHLAILVSLFKPLTNKELKVFMSLHKKILAKIQ